MEQHKSEHWTNGGTGLTNFGPDQFPIFREAVKRLGSDKFVVSEARMVGMGEKCEGGSLHYLGDIRTPAGSMEVNGYWAVFNEIEREQKAAA